MLFFPPVNSGGPKLMSVASFALSTSLLCVDSPFLTVSHGIISPLRCLPTSISYTRNRFRASSQSLLLNLCSNGAAVCRYSEFVSLRRRDCPFPRGIEFLDTLGPEQEQRCQGAAPSWMPCWRRLRPRGRVLLLLSAKSSPHRRTSTFVSQERFLEDVDELISRSIPLCHSLRSVRSVFPSQLYPRFFLILQLPTIFILNGFSRRLQV
ncbi:hypothetical protein C8F04DRAFT_188219 [Mycena alexandri]|uniref:Uncharacterized protein n=1 Tax=Mycena alexandri TaxID=1745969 RepID=A0AAD6T9S5_9AGAR|nr:hypothetical protein C8F04DRAFT_188219 [Mycena alexandri]